MAKIKGILHKSRFTWEFSIIDPSVPKRSVSFTPSISLYNDIIKELVKAKKLPKDRFEATLEIKIVQEKEEKSPSSPG